MNLSESFGAAVAAGTVFGELNSGNMWSASPLGVAVTSWSITDGIRTYSFTSDSPVGGILGFDSGGTVTYWTAAAQDPSHRYP